jgi:hypothetical protein
MNKITFIFIWIVAAFSQISLSQDIKSLIVYSEPKKLENESTWHRDQNGNICASIIIISDMEGFSYDSYDGIIDSVVDKPGEDRIYLTSTEKVLKINKLGYEPLKVVLSDHGIYLKSGDVWQIEIAGEEALELLPVTIKYTPPEAIMMIDSQLVSGYSHQLYPGIHKLQIKKAGFQTIDKEINVNPLNLFFEENLEEVKKVLLEIETDPSNAIILLNEIDIGITPNSILYPPGTYLLKIIKEGYNIIEDTLQVLTQRTRKTYTLIQSNSTSSNLDNITKDYGIITINTYNDADVYFNDQLIPNPKNVKLSPQLVKINVIKTEAETLEKIITLKQNDTIVLSLYPKLFTGILQVAAIPFNSKMELIGSLGEKYSPAEGNIFEDLPVGTYVLRVYCSGYNDQNETVLIKANEIIEIPVTLEAINSEKSKEYKKNTWGPRFALTVPTLLKNNDSLQYQFSTGYEAGLRGEFFRNEYFYISFEGEYDQRAIEIETKSSPYKTIILRPNYLSMTAIGNIYHIFEIGYSKKVLLDIKGDDYNNEDEFQTEDEGFIFGIYHHFLNDRDPRGLGISAGIRYYMGRENAFKNINMGEFMTFSFWLSMQI